MENKAKTKPVILEGHKLRPLWIKYLWPFIVVLGGMAWVVMLMTYLLASAAWLAGCGVMSALKRMV